MSKNTRSFKPENPRKTLIRLFSYFKYNSILFFGGIGFIILAAVAGIATNAMLSPIIDSLVTDYNMSQFIKYIVIMIIIVAFMAIGELLGNLFMARLAQRSIHKIREEMFSHMEQLPISFFDTHSHGELMSTFTNDVDMLNQSLEQSVSQVIVSFITVVGTFIMMVVISPLLSLIVVLFVLLLIVILKHVGGKSSRNFRAQQAQLGEMNGFIAEMMSGQKVVKVFNHESKVIDTFKIVNEKLRISSTNASKYGVMLMPIVGSLSFVVFAFVSMVGAYLVIAGTLTIGNVAAFMQFNRTFFRPITQVSNQLNTLLAAIAGAERIFAMLDEPIEEDTGKIRIKTSGDKAAWLVDGEEVALEGGIIFEDVSFGYLPGQRVLKNINLYAKPGQKIAFVGSTGAGKTTITNLINRFYEINEGKILYDGVNIQDINKHDLRSTLSIVLQDVHLFEGSIKENIRYGRLDATDEEVIEAAKLANADYFISLLPDGYDTYLNVGAENLSQGERQLLSIARAAIANPRILILDEATSSVDTRTEKLISTGMDKLMQGRTTFVIAHRLSTVRDSNAIMVMEHGEIIERGSHDDLMSQKGRYYDLNAGTVELD